MVIIPFLSQSVYAQEGRRIPQSEIENGYTKKFLAVQFGETDVIYGNVKDIIELRYQKQIVASKWRRIKINADTLHFNKKHHLTNKLVGPVYGSIIPTEGQYFDHFAWYREKYVDPKDTAGMQIIDVFSTMTGDIAEHRYIFKDTSKSYSRKLDFDMHGVVDYVILDSKKSILFKEGYRYKSDYVLTGVDDYNANGKIRRRIHFVYTDFDKNGNWTARVERWVTSEGDVEKNLITTRKITYY